MPHGAWESGFLSHSPSRPSLSFHCVSVTRLKIRSLPSFFFFLLVFQNTTSRRYNLRTIRFSHFQCDYRKFTDLCCRPHHLGWGHPPPHRKTRRAHAGSTPVPRPGPSHPSYGCSLPWMSLLWTVVENVIFVFPVAFNMLLRLLRITGPQNISFLSIAGKYLLCGQPRLLLTHSPAEGFFHIVSHPCLPERGSELCARLPPPCRAV